jgi:pimeloyl-ACP methyl ester carboxylesterase
MASGLHAEHGMRVVDTPSLEDRSPPQPLAVKAGGGGVYPSAEARARVMALYDASLRRWPVPFEESDIDTRFGATHVVTAGGTAARPVVLLHGAGGAAPLWRSIIGPLSQRFRVHALDTIGDNGKSELSDLARYPRTGKDYSDWLCDVWARLGLGAADVVGVSMGGWIALHHAAAARACVRHLALLGPMGLSSWAATLRVLAKIALPIALPSRARAEKLISWLVGDDPAALAEVGGWLSATMAARSAPRLGKFYPLSATELRAIVASTLVVLGGRDTVVGDATAVAERVKRYVPDAEVELYPGVGHVMSVEAPELIAQRLLLFLQRGPS